MGLRHTPYDGSKQPFTVGLETISVAEWFEADRNLLPHLERKGELLNQDHGRVFRAEAGTEDAQHEVLDLLLAHLKDHHPSTHTVLNDKVHIKDGPTVHLSGRAPLETASRLVQEDLVIMRASDDGYRLTAASLCFPSSWSLAEKHGRSMRDIHETVPGFNDGRMGAIVARIFQNLTADQLLARYNWSVYDDADLHHPEARQLSVNVSESAGFLAGLFVRVERQTLRRLPRSGDILFTIKIHHDPLPLLAAHPDRANLAAGLANQLRRLDRDQLEYKGLARHQESLAQALEELAGQTVVAG